MSQFINPSKVYTGWIECYFIRPWLRECVQFRGSITLRDYSLSILTWGIITLGIAGLLMGSVGLLGPEVGFVFMKVCGWIWGIFSLVSFTAMTARLLNRTDSPQSNPTMLPIDWLLIISCILFFIFGLLMMTTTINSELLRADPGEQEPTSLPDSLFVSEEPIFTYQESAVDTDLTADSMTDLNDPDMVSPDESFDPTLSGSQSPDNPISIDTTEYF